MFVVLLNYVKPPSEVERVAPEHRVYAARQYASGNFLISGRRPARTGGVIVAQAASRAALDAILQQDPFYREGVADYEVVEFLPMMAGERFADFIVPT